MKKAILLLGLIIFENATAEHSKHDYMGSHGMALFSSPDGGLLVHHLPLYSKPHDYQIIYKVKLAKQASEVLEQNELVTLLPENFDLEKLINGQSFTLSATVFAGHFERGGDEAYRGQIEFLEPVFIRHLSDLESSTNNAKFKHISISDKSNLIVHLIEAAPSFDSVAWLPSKQQIPVGEVTNCRLNAKFLKSNDEIVQTMQSCYGVAPSYSEYQDFQ